MLFRFLREDTPPASAELHVDLVRVELDYLDCSVYEYDVEK